MKKENIQLGDWERLFFGNTPIEFMVEVFLRTIFIYLLLLLILRLLGKRMTSQASILELAVMVTLGAIIALPMQDPQTGLLPGVVILFCVLGFHRFSNWVSFKSTRTEKLVQGKMSMLVKNGVLDVKQMRKAALSHEQLYTQLREKDIRHLGQVQRVYLEACGLFSVFQFEEAKPGLSIIPAKDEKLALTPAKSEKFCACKNCGKIEERKPAGLNACKNCGENDWKPAIDAEEDSSLIERL